MHNSECRIQSQQRWHVAFCILHLSLTAACATRVVPPVPTTPQYPEFLYPAVPPDLKYTPGADRIEYAWRYLQANDLRNAEREFAAAAGRSPGLYPAETGAGYVQLAQRDYDDAIARFDASLAIAPTYVPALVGRGQALLGAKREIDALAAFEEALAVDPSLADVRRRVDVLRFRSAQEVVEAARDAARAGRLDIARDAYRRALEGSPDSAFLHRELGVVERRRGDAAAALVALRKAVELEPSDAASLVQIGELLEEQQDYVGAAEAYRAAAELEPSDALTKRLADLAEKERIAKLPSEFHAIPESEQITRGELAALIGIRLEGLLDEAPPQQVVITDARSHWAEPWVTEVARAGVLDPFPNHTFQPGARVRRGDLAAAVSRLVLLATRDDEARREELTKARPKIADMSEGHLSYPAVAVAVASGVMPLLEGDRFGVTRPVSGAEAIDIIGRVRSLMPESR
jgi:tetratricopeptide (TPR) repeat protein